MESLASTEVFSFVKKQKNSVGCYYYKTNTKFRVNSKYVKDSEITFS